MKYINSNEVNTPIPLDKVKWVNIPGFKPTSTVDETLKFICAFGGLNKKIFEFGTWVGRSALGFTQNFQEVVSIDYIEGSDINYSYSFDNKIYFPGELAINQNNFTLIKENSLTYDFSKYYNYFDVVYVDGNHSEDGCFSDLKNAEKICKKNGIIFVDDYPNETMGVKKAVDKFKKDDKIFIKDILLISILN